jgi:ArsR family transcriptional regulator, arsenate/arsenite/antimonite-responsive transcriptional repressor
MRGGKMTKQSNNVDAEKNLEAKALLFKALGHPTRLLIMNLVRIKARHGEELAAILHLNPATVSHHLSKMAEAGLLEGRKDQYYQMYSLAEEVLQHTLDEIIRLPQPDLQMQVKPDAYQEKVLNTFFKHGRLRQIPAQRKKQRIILEHIAQEFEPDRDYEEMELNRILVEFNDDVAWLRRSLVEHKIMIRADGIYRLNVTANPLEG